MPIWKWLLRKICDFSIFWIDFSIRAAQSYPINNNIMSSEISINICKILNWCLTNTNIKLEVAFYTLRNHNYLAHKSTIGYFNSQALILNTSFRINYHPTQHIILCKISDVREKSDVKLIGQIQIDLNLLAERRTLFVPFQDHDKVLEIKLYEQKKDNNFQSQKSINDEQAEEKREEFLQERFDFLDKLTEHETQLKKNFSEKVYNLLKQLKNKNHESKNDRQASKSQAEREAKNKNQLQFRNRLGQAKKKPEFYQMEPRNNKISPNKHKLDHELLIHSVHAKPEKLDSPQQQRFKAESPIKTGIWQMRDDLRSDRHQMKHQANMGNGFNNSPAFGGIINPYLNQFANY